MVRLSSIKRPTHHKQNRLHADGFRFVAGIDEVGRGSWAGPVTAAAVILDPGRRLYGVRDSKLLSHSQRLKAAAVVRRTAVAVGIGWSSNSEVDEYGLTEALRLAGTRALADMRHSYDAVLLDGNHNYLLGHCYAETLVKADQTCANVAAASIIAKVARDRLMIRYHRLFPHYDWASNKGYGSPRHIEGLAGQVSSLHRRSWQPIQLALSGEPAERFYEFIQNDVD